MVQLKQNVHVVVDGDAPEMDVYARLTDNRLRMAANGGVFIAESPKVIHSALDMGLEPLSLLCEERHLTGDAADVLVRCPQSMPVYTGTRQVLSSLTGYTLTRGVLCAMRRPVLPTVEDVCRQAHRLAIVDQVCDTTNIGSIFRAAAALGIDGVLLTGGTADPLNRRAVRVSMGTVFRVPWTWLAGNASEVRKYGFATVAMALTDNSVPVDAAVLKECERLAIVLGTEGDGLSEQAISDADYVARIPMSRGVDSLNVASAAALTFWELRKKT